MILKFSSITLRKIELSDIEMLRQWRNDEKIAQFMFFNEQISRQMQLDWFNSLAPSDFYFIIEYQDKALGLINLVCEDADAQTAFAGLFIYDDSYWGTQAPVLASICLLQFAFEERKLKEVFAKVQESNSAAKSYNKALGFEDRSSELQCISFKAYTNFVVSLKHRIVKVAL
jgi:RimJ/RimL family protein N-acetyltransferase